MYSIDVIKSMNRRDQKLVETETSRHCSSVSNRRGVILHSAIHRNTVHLKPGACAQEFLRQMFNLDPKKDSDNLRRRDAVIEHFFS